MSRPIYYIGADLGNMTVLAWFQKMPSLGSARWCVMALAGEQGHEDKLIRLSVEVLSTFRYYFDYSGGDIVLCVEDSPAGKNARTHGELHNYAGAVTAGIVQIAMEHSCQVKLILANNKSAKKLITGDGGATKEEVHSVVHKMVGSSYPPTLHDISDALLYAIYGYTTQRPGGNDAEPTA